ncbi:alkylhydroperoxidase AhpD family core domain-containing protein [Paramicrobacterium humi]|uniref:Alkylhydroperoxidase AhpD family core domain-containing protein n=1 Tax=Paramicrobacterium humi TaxID=640635 RepID=A0A1H4NUW6_9MICO|nr:carboxymuconolactone decarboxylase family protein [Microbacterium humi]SEB98991.1 alkylhydroperoxidase AhpD family core domain-containing protein [Microbacterium humi]
MTHVNASKLVPSAYQALIDLEGAVRAAAEKAELDPHIIDLVKIRASQLNGCAFCLRMHTREAIEKGESSDRLAVIAAWWESQYFSPEEQAALAIAERTTDMAASRHLPELDSSALTDEQVAVVVWVTVAINAWNRVAVSSHYPVHP